MKRLLFSFLLVMVSLWAWADNTVTVSYNGNTATVTVDDNVAQYLTVTQSGAHVSIVQGAVTDEITYTLIGSSTDGEFYMSGSYKATIELNGLTLTNTTPVYSGAAVHIQNGKRINVKVITGTTNTLTDAASGSQKGCLYVKGHAEFKQYGTLNVVGNKSHGIKAGEYISIKNATLNITSAVGDGISCNQYFLMESGSVTINGTGDDGIQCDLDGDTSTGMTPNHEDEDSGNVYVSGGTITINCPAIAAKGIKSVGDVYISDNAIIDITTTGNGMWDTTDLEAKAACGLNADGNITISGGTLTLTATGSGGKGMSCDNILTISGGNTTVSTTGGLYYNNGSTEYLNYTGNTENVNSNYYCSPKGVKAGTKTTSGNNTTYSGGIDVSGGIISVTTTGNNAEGIESKNYLNVTGGEIIVDAHDDGINAAQDLTITDGYVYSRGSNNDGIDANGDVLIYGGLIYAVGASSPEVAIDANSEGGKKFYFYGGTLIAIGGLERGSQLSQTCYQASTWSANKWYSMTFANTVIAFKTPSSGGSPLVVSAASTPTLKSNVTVTSGTSIFEGRCILDATVSGGSNVTLSQYNSGGGGTPPGPGQSYTITATANPTAGGSVSGAGTYPRNATCTLIATANSGYTFTNWKKGNTVVSTNATYSFQVTANASFVANFTQNSYTVTATANPPEGGSVAGAGTFNHGSNVTLRATANEGYNFVNWTENGEVVSTETNYSFVITSNRNLVANFEESYPEGAYLTVESYTPDAAPVNQETNMSLSLKNVGADPTDGITFVSLTCDDNRLTLIDGTAEFDELSAGETITLQDAFSFIMAEWVEDDTPFQIDVEMTCGTETWTDQIYVTAHNAVLTYQDMEWDGSFVPGETITLTAKFKNIGHYQATNAEVMMTSSSEYITVSNSPINVNTIAVGEVVSCQFNVAIGANCPSSAVIPVTFLMTADGGLSAQGNETLKNSCIVTFELHDSYSGNDGWNNAKLTVSFDDGTPSQDLTIANGYNSATYPLEISNGTHVTLTWTKGRYDSECSFTVSYEGDLVIYEMTQGTNPNAGILFEFDCNCAAATAIFNVTATSSNSNQGTVSGGGEFSYGESCTVTATPAEGYVFAGWTENGELVSSANPYTFSVTSDHNLVATFIHGIEIGESETSSNYLPSHSWYKQALSQQIYVADEIGMAGTIQYIAFYNEGAERTRTYDFYLKTTEKSSFSSKTDWVTVNESDKVFSGEVTMTANAWTFITFTTPFEYDGTSNLILVADDNSGRYDSAPHMACSVFSTSSSQAIYVYSDNTNYNPMSPPSSYGSGESSAMLSQKNHILLGVSTLQTFTKEINAYTVDGGYYLISVPVEEVAPEDVEHLLDNNYDLYAFDESQELEWINYKNTDNGFANLVTGKGYLYANSEDVTLSLTGTPYNGNGEVTLSKTGDAETAGWNLVGNPFAVTAYLDRDFYVMNDDGSEIVPAERDYIEPMEGAFVVAESDGETLTFSTTASSKSPRLVLDLSGGPSTGSGTAVVDRAIVRFAEGRTLPKLQIKESGSKLFIQQDGKDYAVVNSGEEGEILVGFKAEQSGSYTLSFSNENVEFSYLHLVDCFTGADIDLLSTSSYSFNAMTTDKANRFKVVFAVEHKE